MTLALAPFLILPLLYAAPASPPARPAPQGKAEAQARPSPAPGANAALDATVDAAMKRATEKAARNSAPATRASRFDWGEVPGAIDAMEVPGVLRSDGIPVRLAAVRSREKLDALIRHFYLHFLDSGLFVPKAPEQFQLPRVPMLTGLDPNTLIAYTVLFQPNPDGTTTVVLGESRPAEREKAPAGFDFAPVFPGATNVVKSDAEGMRTITFTAQANSAEVERFYRDVLGKAGAKEIRPGVFQQGGRELRLTSRALEAGQLAVSISERSATMGVSEQP